MHFAGEISATLPWNIFLTQISFICWKNKRADGAKCLINAQTCIRLFSCAFGQAYKLNGEQTRRGIFPEHWRIATRSRPVLRSVALAFSPFGQAQRDEEAYGRRIALAVRREAFTPHQRKSLAGLRRHLFCANDGVWKNAPAAAFTAHRQERNKLSEFFCQCAYGCAPLF